MNILRDNPNIVRATSALLIVSIGAVGCGSAKEAAILSTEITPVTEIYEWPLEFLENEPSSGFELVQIINDNSWGCTTDFEGEIKCSTTYDDDYYGYHRRSVPINSRVATTLELEGREYVGTLQTPPVMDVPGDSGATHYSVESFYEIEIEYTVGDSDKTRTCVDRIGADRFDDATAPRALSGEVTYVDSWGNKSLQFKRDDKVLLKVDC